MAESNDPADAEFEVSVAQGEPSEQVVEVEPAGTDDISGVNTTLNRDAATAAREVGAREMTAGAVSYTHLTLPTIYSV